jgi:hypothetical protein
LNIILKYVIANTDTGGVSQSFTVTFAFQPAVMYSYGGSKTNGLSKGARAGVISAVVIVCGIVILLIGWFLYRNRKLKYTKELAATQEGVPGWPTKWPSRANPTATAQTRNGHGEPVELAPPVYDIDQPLPTYEAGSHQGPPVSYELVNMSHEQRPARQNV